MQELDPQAAEALERARQADGRVERDQGAPLGVDEDGLELASFGQGAVVQGQQGLVRDVRAGGGRVPVVLAQEGGVVVTVEEGIGLRSGERER